MNTAHHLSQDDLALFALQSLPEEELAGALTHMEHCEACRQEVGRFQGDLAAYAMLSEMHSPPALARERLLRRVAKERKVIPMERPVAAPVASVPEPLDPVLAPRRGEFGGAEGEAAVRRGSPVLAWTGWAVAAAMAVAAGLEFHQKQVVQQALTAETAHINELDASAGKAQAALDTLTDAGAMQVSLEEPPKEGAAPRVPVGHLSYSATRGALVFVANNLKPLEPYKTYELWVIPQDQERPPIPAGTFKPNARGEASVMMPDIPHGVPAKGFGVTIEDDGGSKQPTLPIVLAGA